MLRRIAANVGALSPACLARGRSAALVCRGTDRQSGAVVLLVFRLSPQRITSASLEAPLNPYSPHPLRGLLPAGPRQPPRTSLQ
jgi:hypothetical protein